MAPGNILRQSRSSSSADAPLRARAAEMRVEVHDVDWAHLAGHSRGGLHGSVEQKPS